MDEVTGRLVQMGLRACPVCDGGTLNAWHMPAVISIGSVYHEPERRDPADPDVNVMFHVMVMCDMCGHTLFFHLEQFKRGDEPVFAPPG